MSKMKEKGVNSEWEEKKMGLIVSKMKEKVVESEKME